MLKAISTYSLAGVLCTLPLSAESMQTSPERIQDTLREDSMSLPAPIQRWDNALPLGNGLTGGLLWGEGRELRLSLDRGDLWDERGNDASKDPKRNLQTLLESIENKDGKTFSRLFDQTYNGSPWTKIPGARLVMTLPEGNAAENFHLDFEKALATVDLGKKQQAQAFFSATKPVILLKLPLGTEFNLIRPQSIDKLGYPAPTTKTSTNEAFFTQQTAEGLEYTFCVRWLEQEDHLLTAIAITTNQESSHSLALARKYAMAGLTTGWDELLDEHRQWWDKFYNQSEVSIPQPRLQNHYNLVKYYYGSASRADAPPMPLQGVWTADEGSLPPWKGDYHNDLNTQMNYVAWQAAGLEESGMSYINYYVDRMEQFRKYGKEFFGLDTAMVPGVMTLKGQAMGGWPQYAMSMTAGLWNGHALYQHWKVSQDRAFLEKTAYPWLAEIMSSVIALTNEKDGKLYLKLSTSPEWNNGSFNAYLKGNSNFDQALLSWGLGALQEMAEELEKKQDAQKWASYLAKMPSLQVDSETQTLEVARGIPFEHSHRHFSHTLAIHPLGILNIEQGPKQKALVRNSVRQLIDNGSSAWTGYSFTWAASLAARAGFPEDAARLLTDFERAFVTRNGFHVNGDQTKSGLSGFTYRPFTLEGNFLFMDAVQEMYLQSWGETLRIFPSVPADWKDCSFRDLRAEGGLKVSATRKDGMTRSVTISSKHGGQVNLRNPFGKDPYQSSRPIKTKDGLLVATLKAGESITLTSKH
ncbi:hypothetical protein Rhal01_01945 [Rubritalea halochordaticola]|uniref:Glycosyl hydrolase family 95 N-terminal domain-containing protein n=1 Tax=Rubritalea halochordaticola TaxID=714537 RepID=A0ABP9UZ96_9BACT